MLGQNVRNILPEQQIGLQFVLLHPSLLQQRLELRPIDNILFPLEYVILLRRQLRHVVLKLDLVDDSLQLLQLVSRVQAQTEFEWNVVRRNQE